jgi:hypothetical protein
MEPFARTTISAGTRVRLCLRASRERLNFWPAIRRPLPSARGTGSGIFTGHRDAEINEILERHYLHREQREEGLAAIEKLQAKFGGKIA